MKALEGPGSSRPIPMFFGHYERYALLAMAGAYAANDVLGGPDWLAVPTGITVGTWLFAEICDYRVHQRQLCERCAAAAPLDPQAAVRRWRPALRANHSIIVNLLVLAVLALWLTRTFVHGWPYAADLPAFAVLGAFGFIGYQHSRLQPWCPWCRWGDGGDEETSPDVPAPAQHA